MSGDAGLEIRDLTVAFGGNVVLSALSLDAPRGQITGLIGPNGAGKTTTFNACSGLIRLGRGSIQLFDRDITAASSAHRARLGLGRSFQQIELCASMTVRQNIEIGCEAHYAGAHPFRQFRSPRGQKAQIAIQVDGAIARCDLIDIADDVVGSLSTGRRRLVELARLVASGFSMLLLDEPSSGLDDTETRAFATILRSLVTDTGVGILLVEHDMSLVMSVCDQIYVLDFGTLIFAGTAAEVQGSDIVRMAYLGSQPLEQASP